MANDSDYDSLSDKELIKKTIEKMALVKATIRDIKRSLSKIEGSVG
ncbi:MAG: hypothetical protein ACW99U_06520 [Candidatus Thorarchaeota archaeon]|jgi:hypothetical protein